MQHFKKILAGVDLSSADRMAATDLSPPTREAVKRAVWLAGHLSAELTFFAALNVSAHTEELLHDGYEEATRSVEEATQLVLDELVADAKRDGVNASARFAFGRPWEAVIKEVVNGGHDLAVVGTSSRGVSQFLFGKTGTKLLRHCPCPVWVTRPDPDWDNLNMLVATDLTEVGQKALNVAVNGAQLASARVHVISVIEDQLSGRLWLSGLPASKLDDFRAKRHAQVEEMLHEQLAQTDYRTLTKGVQVHIAEGAADVAILKAIEELGIDLLVMGTVARSGIPGLIIGNTAERLLSQVPCSVLAVKPDDFVCPVQPDD